MGFFSDDIVKDILLRVIEAAQRGEGGFSDAQAQQIEQQVRRDWGGTEPYIAHGREERIAERNEKILRLWDEGQRDMRMLAQRFGLSTKQVRRIVDK